jgi:hypothetical protein
VELPKILDQNDAFRRIEKPAGRSLDAIAVAATSAFASLQRPTRQDRAQLDLLIRPNIGDLAASSLTNISATLCNSRHAPVQLLHALAALPVEICAPLIMRSPLLTDDFLEMIAAQKGESHSVVIAKRFELRSRQGDTEAKPRRAEFTRAIHNAFRDRDPSAMRDEFVKAVCIGHDVSRAKPENEGAGVSLADDLLPLALSENPAFLATRLCDALDLPLALAEAAVKDAQAGEFATMLKAMDADVATAMAVIFAASRGRSADADRVRLVFARYLAMNLQDARDTVARWRDTSEVKAYPANLALRAVTAA